MVIDYPLYIEITKLKELERALSEQGRILKSIKFYPKNRCTVMTTVDPVDSMGEITTQDFDFNSILYRMYAIFEQQRDWEDGMRYMTHYENMRWWGSADYR
jgi:hypothetical protein